MGFDAQAQSRAMDMAAKMANDFDERAAKEFINKHEDKSWYEDFMTLFQMLTTPGFHLSPLTWGVIAGTLAYVVFPFDVLPDFIPFFGWADDAFVLGAVIWRLKDEIERFRAFLGMPLPSQKMEPKAIDVV